MRKIFAICGVFLLCIGGGLSLFILTSEYNARSLDSPLDVLGCDICSPPPVPPSCSKEAFYFIQLDVSKVMSVSEFQKLTASVFNWGEKACRVSIILDAPNFTTSSEKKLTFSIARYETTEFKWVLSPDKPGTYSVVVSITTGDDVAEIIDSKDVGISVTNVFGLQANQVSLLSMLSAAFGPILTIPFWLDKWQKRKERESKLESKNEN